MYTILKFICRYGPGIGRLTAYLQLEGFQPLAMWTLAGEQQDDWLQAKVGFAVNSDHSLLLEAKIVELNDGDIGIDDVSITNGYCNTLPPFAVPQDGFTTVPTPATTKV